jgi:hypothetical protein
VVRELVRSERPSGRATAVDVRATLAAPVPASVVALVAAPAGGGTRGSWAAVSTRDANPLVYAYPGRCSPHAPGHAPPSVGDSIVVSFVDAGGRRSAPSAPIVVR